MTAKIFDIFTGREIEGPEALTCDKRAPAKRTKVVKASSREFHERTGKELMKALERKIARSLT